MDEYRGYQLRWIDWLSNNSNILMNGIWAAQKEGFEHFLYVVVPFGGSGIAHSQSQILDIALKQHWSNAPVTVFSTPDHKAWWKEMGLDEIKKLTDWFIDKQKEVLPFRADSIGLGSGSYTTHAVDYGDLAKQYYDKLAGMAGTSGYYTSPNYTYTVGNAYGAGGSGAATGTTDDSAYTKLAKILDPNWKSKK